MVSEDEVAEAVFDIPSIYDEPFADSSSVPTCLVSRLARGHVKVVMSADGGDELFCGYRDYVKCLRYADIFAKTPGFARGVARKVLEGLETRRVGALARISGSSSLGKLIGVYERERAALLAAMNGDMAGMNRDRRASWVPSDLPEMFGRAGGVHDETFSEEFVAIERGDLITCMLYGDFRIWLPDDILTKADKASMSVGLEARVPLLDHRLVSFSASLPADLRYRNGETKYLMKKTLSRHLPEEIWKRPKRGFSSPVNRWLRGRFRNLVEEYLGPRMGRRSGIFDLSEVSRWTERFYNGFSAGHRQIWNLLMFQMWHERWY